MAYHISLLEKLGVTSIVMSYFGYTHRAFLILTRLSRQSRKMLDQNYDAFMNSMVWNNAHFDIQEDIKLLKLPWNLFRYSIKLYNRIILLEFIKIIENISNNSGYYFNDHFMHSRLCIDKIIVDIELIEPLYLDLELLMKTKVIEHTNLNY